MSTTSRPGPGRGEDDGSATIYVLALAAVLWLAGLVVLLVAQVAVARSRAATAADLGALAGASHVLSGQACSAVAVVVRAQDARPEACQVDGWDVRVRVSVRLKGPLAGLPPVEARAHAGPAPSSAR